MADGPLPAPLLPLARAVVPVYRSVVARRNRAWDAGRGVVTIDRPVVSIGNLSVGGTGKTPMVNTVVGWLLGAGRTPAIAMRGYAAKGGLSDEAAEYAALHGQRVPVVAQPDRLEGLLRLFAGRDDVDCVVLDDGFQHRRIARQCDVVLVDASRDPFADGVLPAGWLREPVASLVRADAVVITHAEMAGDGDVEALRGRIGGVTDAPVAVCSHEWTGLDMTEGGSESSLGPGWLAGKRVFAACAIGNPGGFLASARAAVGGDLGGALVLRDHDPYSPRTVSRLMALAEGCDALLVTPKDWAKLRRVEASRWRFPVIRPRLTMGFTAGKDHLRELVGSAVARGVRPEA